MKHDNIVRLLDVFAEGQTLVIVVRLRNIHWHGRAGEEQAWHCQRNPPIIVIGRVYMFLNPT